MLELILAFILFGSLIGIVVIIVRKIPVLAELAPEKIKRPGALRALKYKIGQNGTVKSFSGEILLQKILSKFRVLTLKTDSKTSAWLEKSRKRSIKSKNDFSDDYWQKLKGGK